MVVETRMTDLFNTKYEEFARDLLGACPEMTTQIQAAIALSPEERRAQFRSQVLPFCAPSRNKDTCPDTVLPGVSMSKGVWEQLSEKSHQAIQEHMTLLGFVILIDAAAGEGEGAADGAAGLPEGWTEKFTKEFFNDMKGKMAGIDFASLGEKMAKMFGGAEGGLPKLPEKFLKGQIARLAEEIVGEFKIEDLGFDPAQVEAANADPSKALQLVMDVFLKNPGQLQKTIGRLTKKLQQKIQSGSIRPSELVAEAEELMKTFSENPQFVEMMESFRQAFGMAEDPDLARASGNEGSARLNMVKARLRKKLEAKRGGKK
jgi:hypothetical protein